jgi:hypothetical protein
MTGPEDEYCEPDARFAEEAHSSVTGGAIYSRGPRGSGRQERRPEDTVEAPLIYAEYPFAPELLRHWDRKMLEKHLHRLQERGLVEKTEKGYVRTGLA